MSSFLRHGASAALALALTAWILFRAPAPSLVGGAAPAASPPLELELLGELQQLAQAAEIEAPEAVEPVAEPEPEPAPKEAGSRTGSDAGRAAAAPEAAEEPEDAEPEPVERPREEPEGPGPGAPTVAELRSDAELVRLAHAELQGEAAHGFSTVLYSNPGDQLAIARAFGEELILVPRAAIDPDEDSPRYWRIDPASLERGRPRIQAIDGRPALADHRQHRSLLRYDYSALPPVLRELRQRVVRRDDLFLFSALIPASEWAVVIGRRRAACMALGLDETDVEQFVLRYVRGDGGFDIVVDEVVTADGRRLRTPPSR